MGHQINLITILFIYYIFSVGISYAPYCYLERYLSRRDMVLGFFISLLLGWITTPWRLYVGYKLTILQQAQHFAMLNYLKQLEKQHKQGGSDGKEEKQNIQ